MTKPNGAAQPPDPSLNIPATFVNDFRLGMNEDFCRLTFVESDNTTGHLRGAIVAPTPVLVELAEKIVNASNQMKARARIIMPGPGANLP